MRYRLAQTMNLGLFALGVTAALAGPAKVSWEVTHRCNLRCRHCHLWQKRDHDELSTEDGMRLIDELADMHTIHLSFTGGEPLLRADTLDLIAYANSRGLTTGMNTNGTKLRTMDQARQLCDTRLGAVYISLDGPNAESHNAVRGSAHAFDSVMGAIDSVLTSRRDGSPMVFVNTTITRNNMDQIEEIADLARCQGVDGMTMSVLQSVDVYSPDDDLRIDPAVAPVLVRRLKELTARSEGLIPHSDEYLNGIGTYLQSPNALYKYRCAAAHGLATIHPNGDVHPCPVSFAKLGSLREGSFREIWRSPRAADVRRMVDCGQHPICWLDCVAPMNVLLTNLGKLRWRAALHSGTVAHVVKKMRRLPYA